MAAFWGGDLSVTSNREDPCTHPLFTEALIASSCMSCSHMKLCRRDGHCYLQPLVWHDLPDSWISLPLTSPTQVPWPLTDHRNSFLRAWVGVAGCSRTPFASRGMEVHHLVFPISLLRVLRTRQTRGCAKDRRAACPGPLGPPMTNNKGAVLVARRCGKEPGGRTPCLEKACRGG